MRLAIEDVIEEEAAESQAAQAETPEPVEPPKDAAETELERPTRLHGLRLDTVLQKLREIGARGGWSALAAAPGRC